MPEHMTNDETMRPVWPAMRLGLRRRCPNCGTGAMFQGYLKIRHSCPDCGQELHHHRADDGPAYLTILIVGHILAPTILFLYTTFRPEPLLLASLLSLAAVSLSLFLLPRLKGFMIGFQWAKRMHGFGSSNPEIETHDKQMGSENAG